MTRALPPSHPKSRAHWNFEIKECVECGEWFVPTSSASKYCIDPCRKIVRQRQKRACDIRTNDTRKKYWSEYSKLKYDMFERHYSKITHRPDFVAFVKTKILSRRGDMMNVKSLVRQTLSKLDIKVDNRAEYEKCYAAVVNIVRSLGGKEVGRNARDSLIFQWKEPKK